MVRLCKFIIMLSILLVPLLVERVQGEEKTFTATIGDDGVQRVEILGGEYFFDPDHIIVKVNVPVEFTVKKEPGLAPHNIVMEEQEAGIVFDEDMGKDPTVITFTPRQTGTFPFYCTKRFLFFKSHREKGMKGILEVVE